MGNTEPNRIGVGGVLRQLLAWSRPHALASLAVLGLVSVQVAYYLAVPFAFKIIFDEVIPRGDLAGLGRVLAALGAGYLACCGATLLAERTAARVATRVTNHVRLRLFEQIQALPPAQQAGRAAGDLLSRFTTDLESVENGALRPLPRCLFLALKIGMSLLLLFWVDWRLALATFLALPLALLGPRVFGARAHLASHLRKQDEARLAATVHESLAVGPVVRAFGLQELRLAVFVERLRSLGASSDASSFWGALVGRSASLGIELVQLLIVGVGAFFVLRGPLSVGSLIGFVGLLLNAATSASAFSQLVPPFVQSSGGMQRILELLAVEPAVRQAHDARPLPGFAGELRFEEVSFAYAGRPVLQGVSFTVRAGERVAFVGPSGSGKSTLLGLVQRFHDPSRGRVTIDGHDLRQLTERSLRSLFGVVLQDTALFDGTIRENIRMGRPQARDDEVEAAGRSAELHALLGALPDGYETHVGERGGSLSGGQRQRVAIARALLRNPAILLLDEATSALDPHTAAAINATLQRLESGRTVITVTHSLFSVAHCDRIFVMQEGRLQDHGRHAELLARPGVYRELWHKQSGFSVTESGDAARLEPERLRLVPLFALLEEALLEPLSGRFGSESLPAGRVVFQAGDPGEKLFLIVRGSVEVRPADGRPPVVLETGDHFGELALLDGTPRNATLTTRTACLFLTLPRQQFQQLLRQAPQFRASIERAAAARRAAAGPGAA